MFRERQSLDRRLLLLARTRGHTPERERVVVGFSRLGEHGALWLATALAGAALQPRASRQWREAASSVLCAYAANTTIKMLVRRRRPSLAGLPPLMGTTTGLSFPSAHSATSFAAAHAYRRRGLPATPLYALAGTMALSRLYLGVHYPSDVLAGALLGGAVARVADRFETGEPS